MLKLSTKSLEISLTGKLVLKVLFVLIVLVGLLEGVARLPWPTDRIPAPSMGTYYIIDIELSRLADYVQENDGVDVIIFGSSLAHSGLDPEIIENVFQQGTGQNLRVFNCGVTGMSLLPATSFVKIITQSYNPTLIIHVTEMRDYSSLTTGGLIHSVANDPWFHYKLGKFSPKGWIIDHSMAMQRYLSFRFWVRDDFPAWYSLLQKRLVDITPWGFEADRRVADDLNASPDPNNEKDKYMLDAYEDYQVAPERVESLKDVLSQPDKKVVIVEMPVHSAALQYFGDPSEDYQEYITTVEQTVQDYGGKFISTANLNIPNIGYSNKFHLNQDGAPLFSEFLAQELVHLYNTGWYQP
ncbi:MAG: hypothetical protein B6I38_08050 [Anaerolineaceae bacterium 4572_5.1]|nr:MAG: hypothetical protein B6I38_08050 [Anaerolineaceae bacterium 4572_5.1]